MSVAPSSLGGALVAVATWDSTGVVVIPCCTWSCALRAMAVAAITSAEASATDVRPHTSAMLRPRLPMRPRLVDAGHATGGYRRTRRGGDGRGRDHIPGRHAEALGPGPGVVLAQIHPDVAGRHRGIRLADDLSAQRRRDLVGVG